jgi:hypothetical protein
VLSLLVKTGFAVTDKETYTMGQLHSSLQKVVKLNTWPVSLHLRELWESLLAHT